MDKKLLRTIYNICVLILLVIGAWLVVNHFVHFGDGEFTDNATVQQHITPVNTRVGGFIKEIRFSEYQPVHKGDTLVIIEDSEFRLQLAQAEANLQREMAGGEATTSGIGVTRQNMSIGEVESGEIYLRLRHLDGCLVLRQTMSLLLLGTVERGTAAHHLLIAGLGSEIVGVNLVVLLLCHSVGFEQLGVALLPTAWWARRTYTLVSSCSPVRLW